MLNATRKLSSDGVMQARAQVERLRKRRGISSSLLRAVNGRGRRKDADKHIVQW